MIPLEGLEKVIFLDVDGVLNNGTWAQRMYKEEGVRVYAEDLLEDRALRLLKLLVDETGARIVISSAWRRIPTAYDNLITQLHHHGIEVADQTPYVGSERGDDITAWFSRHPNTERYVILDDDSDMGDHMEHLVKTDFNTGLTREIVDRCIALLND